ncbi:putative cytochrome p450 oxidoreductase [Rhypophila decipiens]|uniref:Cytochrome p450 oxidoreductase n=1 Tax=Rhypophila decipiens TaxID=261697 RepID=A0AAN7BAR2_9PEZI|nr:putative cytochrome p450 oxidoreductase [Rhypophila decipiens]
MASLLIVSLIGFAVVYLLLWTIIIVTQDENEPPLAKTSFPFLSPLVGMIRGGPKFYVDQRDKHNHAIYTLRLPFQKIYVINSTNLIPALQKQWRLISFASLFAGAGKVVGMSDSACDVMHEHLTDETKNFNYTWVARASAHLTPGSKGLDEMNRVAIGVVSDEVEALVGESLKDGKENVIGLQEWVFKSMLLASTDAVYGGMNPMRDAAVARAWNTVEQNYLTLVLSPLPKFLTRIFIHKVIQAREAVVSAFVDFIKKGGTKTASSLLQAKHAHHGEKLRDEDIARTDLGFAYAILGNTGPAAWWFVYHIFRDENLVRDIREELVSAPGLLTRIDDGGKEGECVMQVELAKLRNHCPILLSTLQETLRYRTVSNSVRRVLEQDVLLDGQYLLKKGSLVMLPHAVQHSSTKAFGEDAREFDHLRFVRGRGQQGEKQKGGLDRRAFYAFGGGHETCPGRHFVTMELMALAALMVLRLDIEPVRAAGEEKGEWIEPSCENSPMASGLPYPDEDIFVRARERDWSAEEKGQKRKIVDWKVCYSGSETALDIGAERDDTGME